MGKKFRLGFTLTELSVAIAFISILLLTVAVVTVNMVRTYHKGRTMKEINTIGLDLIDEFNSAISESPVFSPETLCKTLGDIGTKDESGKYTNGTNGADTCMNDNAKAFVYQQFEDNNFVVKGVVNQERPTYGVFCTGKYSYVWQTGFLINAIDSANHTMSSGFYENNALAFLNGGFRLRKYSDPTRDFCANNIGSSYGSYSNNISDTIRAEIGEEENRKSKYEIISDELINTSDIALYSLTVDSPVVNSQSGRAFFSGSFVLGSITGDIEINENENYSSCNLEGTSSFDVEYCATNKFKFAIRAMGGNNGS